MPSNRDILIIEDNSGDVRLMREALRDLDPPVTIHVASDGEEAMNFLRRRGNHAGAPRPRLIFLDFHLPKSDSRSLLKEIKEDRELGFVPLAVLTSSDSEKDVRDAYQFRANCFLRKPVDLDSFFFTIRSATSFWLDIARIPS